MNYLDRPKLSKITNEIHFFNEQGIKVSIEVGNRLDEAKAEFPNSEEWMLWAESEFGYKKSQAYKLVAIAKRFHSSGNLLEGKTINEVYALAAFNDEELEKPTQLPTGEVKPLIEMDLREIERYKKALQDSERDKAAAQSNAIHLEKLVNSYKNQPPRVETKTVEVVPEHLKKKLEQLEFDNGNLRHGYKSTKEKLQQYELKNTVEFDSEQAQKQRDKLQHEADYSALELRVHITNFMEKAAITAYMKGALAAADSVTKKRLLESVGILEEFTNQIKAALNGRILGGIVNE